MRHTIFAAIGACTFALACSNEQPGTQPIPPLVSEAGTPQPASPPRTVGHRNPFGDVLQADNLMADGDFELTGRSDQAPWLAFDSSGQSTLNYDTGGLCRSGVRCAVVATGETLIGYMASPAQSDYEIRAYIKPESNRCADAQVIAIDLINQQNGTIVQPTTPQPDETGWCLFMQSATNLAYQQPMIYIDMPSSAKGKSFHVDQVSVLPVGEAPAHKLSTHGPPLPARAVQRVAFIAEWIRTHRIVGRPAVPPENARNTHERFVAP